MKNLEWKLPGWVFASIWCFFCCHRWSSDCKSLVVATYRHVLTLKKSGINLEHEKWFDTKEQELTMRWVSQAEASPSIKLNVVKNRNEHLTGNGFVHEISNINGLELCFFAARDFLIEFLFLLFEKWINWANFNPIIDREINFFISDKIESTENQAQLCFYLSIILIMCFRLRVKMDFCVLKKANKSHLINRIAYNSDFEFFFVFLIKKKEIKLIEKQTFHFFFVVFFSHFPILKLLPSFLIKNFFLLLDTLLNFLLHDP